MSTTVKNSASRQVGGIPAPPNHQHTLSHFLTFQNVRYTDLECLAKIKVLVHNTRECDALKIHTPWNVKDTSVEEAEEAEHADEHIWRVKRRRRRKRRRLFERGNFLSRFPKTRQKKNGKHHTHMPLSQSGKLTDWNKSSGQFVSETLLSLLLLLLTPPVSTFTHSLSLSLSLSLILPRTL